MELSKTSIINALDSIPDPDTGQGLVASGMVSGIAVRESGKVGFLITIAAQDKARKSYLREAAEQVVRGIAGVTSVTAVLTAESGGEALNPHQQAHVAGGGDPKRTHAQWNLTPLPNVSQVIAVASGKGGVGKSTTTVNLAHALVAMGKRVGILDADIYGPSIPRMLGASGQPEIQNGRMQPVTAHGIASMSMGYITGDEAAILRGPMLTKTLQQLLRNVEWGVLDVLLVDMPPGTGDIHLSMAQQVPLSGAIIVTTPQEVAVMDARKCARMFVKLGVPIRGIIENMSYFTEPVTGTVHALFGEGGGATLATEFSAPLLGKIPLLPHLREAADSGASPQKEAVSLYQTITQTLGI